MSTRAVWLDPGFVAGPMRTLRHTELLVYLYALAQSGECVASDVARSLELSLRRVQLAVAVLIEHGLLAARGHLNSTRRAFTPIRLDQSAEATAIRSDQSAGPTAIRSDQSAEPTAIHSDQSAVIHSDQSAEPTAIHSDQSATRFRALSSGTDRAAVNSCSVFNNQNSTGQGRDLVGSGIAANIELGPTPVIESGRDFTGETLREWIETNLPASGEKGSGGWRRGQALKHASKITEVEAPSEGEAGEPRRSSFAEIKAYLTASVLDPSVLKSAGVPLAVVCSRPELFRAWLVQTRRADARARAVVAARKAAAEGKPANVQAIPTSEGARGLLERLNATVVASVADRPTRPNAPGVSKTHPGVAVPPPDAMAALGLSRVGSGPSAPRRQ